MTTQHLAKTHHIPHQIDWQQWGIYGFLFFFLKGILWAIAPILIYQFH